MKIKKTAFEALSILIISAFLCLLFSLLSPAGRVLLKKGLRIRTGAEAFPTITALRGGS